MRGAVLHKLGLNVVRERLMRRHYGVSYNRGGFNPRRDPAHLKGYDAAGEICCHGVMRWYAKKVHSRVEEFGLIVKGEKMPNGQAKRFSFCTKFSEAEYDKPGPLTTTATLSVCESEEPPEFDNDTGLFTDDDELI